MFLTPTKILIAIVGTFLFAENATAACGKFVVVKGDVQIDLVKTHKSEKAKVNSEICAGDGVSAGNEARAKIVMVDGNELNVSPDTKLVIEGYEYQPDQDKKKVLINVMFGKIRANVKQKYDDESKDSSSNSFQVKTKSAVAGVRGTDFLTSFNQANGKSEVVTFSGKVDVGQVGPKGQIINSVSVSAGQKTFSAPNQPPAPPVMVPASELKQLNNSTNASNASPNSGGTASNSNNKNQQANNNSNQQDQKDAKDPNAKDPGAKDPNAKPANANGPGPNSKDGPAANNGGQATNAGPSQNSPSQNGSSTSAGGPGPNGPPLAGPGGAGPNGPPLAGPNGSPLGPPTGDRLPAGAPPPMMPPPMMPSIGSAMIDTADLGGAAGSKTPNFSSSPVGLIPNLPIITTAPPIVQPPICNFCNTIIQNGGPAVINISIIPKR